MTPTYDVFCRDTVLGGRCCDGCNRMRENVRLFDGAYGQ